MLGNKFKEVIKNLESHIKDKKDLEYAKKQVTELTMEYLEELGKLEENYDLKFNQCSQRIDEIEQTIEKMDEENIISEEDVDMEPITCPYCNIKFLIEYDSRQKEVKCPDCKNIIELDWESYDDDM